MILKGVNNNGTRCLLVVSGSKGHSIALKYGEAGEDLAECLEGLDEDFCVWEDNSLSNDGRVIYSYTDLEQALPDEFLK